MSVRVTVSTHGAPATVTVEGQEPVQVAPRSSHSFHTSGTQSISIAEEEPSAQHGIVEEGEPQRPLDTSNVPGRKQNDELLGRGKQQPLKGQPPATEGENTAA